MRNGMQVAYVLFLASLCLATAMLGAPPPQEDSSEQRPPALVTPEPPEWEDRSFAKLDAGESFEAPEVRRIVADLSRDASVDEIELALFELMPQIYRATKRDLPVVGEALAGLRQQPNAVAAIASQYGQLPVEAFEKRLTVIGLLGELSRPEVVAPLTEVVWAPLPAAEAMAEGLSARDLEEMIQAKAVQGLAYLATPVADDAVRDVIVNHEALHVRVSAIDAYMWNHGDSRETADQLYRLLPAEMHLYVERPRFHRDMDPEEFSRRLAAWREKWSREPTPTPARDADREGGVK